MHSFVIFAAVLACASAQFYHGLGYAAYSPLVYGPTHHVAQAGSTLSNPGATHIAPLPQPAVDTPEVTHAKIAHFNAHALAGRKRRGVAYSALPLATTGYSALGYSYASPVAYHSAVHNPVAYHAATVPVSYGYSGLGHVVRTW